MTIEYTTLGIYFAFLLVIGIVFARFNRNLSDFVRGGARGTWWLVGTSILMAGISAFTFTGNASSAFEAGPSLLIIYAANVLGLLVGGLFLGAWYRQTRAYTGADVIRARFGTPVEQFSVYSGVLLGPFSAAVQLWALSIFVSSVFGFPLQISIIAIGVITLAYSSSGGMWAVMATDVLQSVVLYGITVLTGVMAFVKMGGPAGLISHFSAPALHGSFDVFKSPGEFPGDRYTWMWALVIFTMQLVGQVNLGSAPKYLAAKDGREASRASYWAMGLMIIGSLFWFLPPMLARFLYEAEVLALPMKDPATASYAVAAVHLLPAGMLGVMIAAMFSATMSSMDMGLNQQTGVIVRNMIPRLREKLGMPPLRESTEVRLCRIISISLGIVIMLLALGLALQEKFVLFDAFLLIGSIIGIPLGLPLLMGLLFRRLPSWSYFAIFGGSLLPSIYSVVQERMTGAEWTIQTRGLWVFLFGIGATGVCLACNRFSSARHREREREFFKTMHTPVDFEEEIGAANDGAQALIMGRCIVAMGVLLLGFLFVPNPLAGKVFALVLAAFVLAVGVLLYWAGRRMERLRTPRGKFPTIK